MTESAAMHARLAAAKLAFVLMVAAIVVVLILLHAPGMNGPAYWKWEWRRLEPLQVYVLLPLAAVPIFVAQWLDGARTRRRVISLVLLTVGTLTLRYASVLVQTRQPSFQRIETVIRSDAATSYYTDALGLSRIDGWFGAYDQVLRLPGLHLHTISKPPGPVLFFSTMIRMCGDSAPAIHIAAAIMGLLAALAVPATYLLLRRLTPNSDAALCGASYLALAPGFVLFFPMFDPIYILLSCGLIGFWARAVDDRSTAAAVGMGLVLALVCVVTFNVLVVGFFCAVYPIVVRRAGAGTVFRQAGIVLLTMAAALGCLWLVTGYNPIATFESAWHNQHALLTRYADQRPYPKTVLFDLTDFALGSGWSSIALVILYFLGQRPQLGVVCLGLAQIGLVAVLGLLQAETARVWNFMLPLLVLPIGLELAGWPARYRAAALIALLAVTCAVSQNMKFIF